VKGEIAKVVTELAPRYAVDPRFALAIIAVESNYERTARSEKDARGLMQLIPETATRFNVRDAYNVKDNIRGGLSYLQWLLAYYRGKVELAAGRRVPTRARRRWTAIAACLPMRRPGIRAPRPAPVPHGAASLRCADRESFAHRRCRASSWSDPFACGARECSA
jgi:hypothetical protein